MRLIDAHAHLFSADWYPRAFLDVLVRDFEARLARKGFGSGLPPARLIGMISDPTGEKTVRLMDRVGIDKRVVLVVDWGLALGEAVLSIDRVHREVLAACRRFPDRLVGFAGLDPRRPDGPDILRFAFDHLGAKGLKLHPTDAWHLLDDRTLGLVSIAAERGLPVLVHLGRTFEPLTDERAQPDPFVDLSRRFPRSTFIAGHSGYERWREFAEIKDLPDNILFDISGWQGWAGGDGEVKAELAAIQRTFPGRVIFGTDSPFFTFNLASMEKRWIEVVSEATGSNSSMFEHPSLVGLFG